MVAASAAGHAIDDSGTDQALCVTVPLAWAEIAGAVLMDLLGPFEWEEPRVIDAVQAVTLIFYPGTGAEVAPEDITAALPSEIRKYAPALLSLETRKVSREWVDGWRAHFHPLAVGAVRIRPPWEPALGEELSGSLVDVVINPGLGFGTGLHPTTRGILHLLQRGIGDHGASPGRGSRRRLRGALVDAGTGSGVLAIAAAKLGWGPILVFDNDATALVSARENIVANGAQDVIEVHELGVAEAPERWFEEATVLANMTLEPVSLLLRRLGTWAVRPARLLVSGILAGAQEQEVLRTAWESGFVPGGKICEDEWVSLEFVPMVSPGAATPAGAAPEDGGG